MQNLRYLSPPSRSQVSRLRWSWEIPPDLSNASSGTANDVLDLSKFGFLGPGGQTIGFLAEEQGFTDATEMVAHMTGSIPGQIDCMLRELTRKKLIQPLNNRQYVQVAKVYNGAGYAQNSYDTKLADADKRWARRLANTPLDRAPPPEQSMSRSTIRQLPPEVGPRSPPTSPMPARGSPSEWRIPVTRRAQTSVLSWPSTPP